MAESTTAVQTFDRLDSRYRLRGRLEAQTALRVGGGKSTELTASDQPVMRDGRGMPFLPGSSLKGALRAGLERTIRGLASNQLRACDPFDKQDACSERVKRWIEDRTRKSRQRPGPAETLAETQRVTCTVCGLFGSSYLAGRLFVHDLPVVVQAGRHQVLFEVRDGVGLNRDLGTAQHRVKYDVEVVPVGTEFALELLLENPSDVQYALVLKMLQLLDEGLILLGGLTSRGLGRVRLARDGHDNPLLEIERATAQSLLGGLPPDRPTYVEEQARADATLRELLARKER